MDESARDRRHRRRWPAVRGHRPAVPRRAGRRPAAPARRARARVVRAHGRRDAPRARHRPQRPPPRRGRVQGARPGAAGGLRAGSAARRRRLDEGLARMSDARPADRRRRLRRGQPREHRAGAHARRGRGRRRHATPDDLERRRRARRARRRRRGAGDGAARAPQGLVDPILGWIAAGPAVPRHLPRAPAPVRASDEDEAATLGVLPGRTRPPRGRADPPAHRLEPGRAPRDHPVFDGIADGADFYFVHSYAGAPADDAETSSSPRPSTAVVRLEPSPRRPARRPVPPRAERRRRPPPARELRRARARGGRAPAARGA